MTVIDYADAAVGGEARMGLPMGPFPARLRIGPSFDHIDVVVGEFGDTTGAEEAWEHGLVLLRERFGIHIGRPGLAVTGGLVIITFGFPAQTASIEFAAMLAAAAVYAATMASALSEDLLPAWRAEMERYGIGERDPRWLLQGHEIASWPSALG